ncbi:MAG: hypothetical protein H7146_13750 [Burkholderiaceae bacterium]|nr:hypothetical protein [Microbacteriaceae bacterium]
MMSAPLPSLVRLDNTPEFDPNTVTPGVVGFFAIFVLAALVVLLVLDMVRRVRRLRYREEIKAQLDAEEAAALEAESGSLPDEADDADNSSGGPARSSTDL